MTSTQDTLRTGGTQNITVQVNSQSVTVTERRLRGREIKQAAISQGVTIEPGFQLSVRRGNRYEVIGDDDTVTLREGLDFVAVAPDDNS